jgi:hypothetical protein
VIGTTALVFGQQALHRVRPEESLTTQNGGFSQSARRSASSPRNQRGVAERFVEQVGKPLYEVETRLAGEHRRDEGQC